MGVKEGNSSEPGATTSICSLLGWCFPSETQPEGASDEAAILGCLRVLWGRTLYTSGSWAECSPGEEPVGDGQGQPMALERQPANQSHHHTHLSSNTLILEQISKECKRNPNTGRY